MTECDKRCLPPQHVDTCPSFGRKTITLMGLYADEEGRPTLRELINKQPPGAVASFPSFETGMHTVQRVGYRGFWSMVWMLWRQNRATKRMGIKARYTVDLPLRWFR